MPWKIRQEPELRAGMRIRTGGGVMEVLGVTKGGATVKAVKRFKHKELDGEQYNTLPSGTFTICRRPHECEVWE